jgi:hypothetical protein
VLLAETTALRTGSSLNDSRYLAVSGEISALGSLRDSLATKIKNALFNAEFNDAPIPDALGDLFGCDTVLVLADGLAYSAGHGAVRRGARTDPGIPSPGFGNGASAGEH